MAPSKLCTLPEIYGNVFNVYYLACFRISEKYFSIYPLLSKTSHIVPQFPQCLILVKTIFCIIFIEILKTTCVNPLLWVSTIIQVYSKEIIYLIYHKSACKHTKRPFDNESVILCLDLMPKKGSTLKSTSKSMLLPRKDPFRSTTAKHYASSCNKKPALVSRLLN